MAEQINRRTFFRQTAAIGVGSLVTRNLVGAGLKPDISVVAGDDYFKNTLKAVEQLGGMEKFVKKGARIALLANPQRNNPGAYTSPQVLKAVIHMCKTAGAGEVNCISWLPEKNWESTGLKKVIEEEGAHLVITNLRDESRFRPVKVTKGKKLKEARLLNTLFENDAFITVPICKDHAGNKFTGTLKNMMGINSPGNNRTFHKKDWITNPDSVRFLDQCIADLNLALKPVLCVVDATEFIISNGPFGPGKLHFPRKVVAGVDRVAIDAYCCTLWGLTGTDIHMITMAHESGLGEINLKKVTIKETRV